jgi:hypothetical protein
MRGDITLTPLGLSALLESKGINHAKEPAERGFPEIIRFSINVRLLKNKPESPKPSKDQGSGTSLHVTGRS